MDDVVFERRRWWLAVLAGLAAGALLAFLLARGLLRETPGVNSFGALADAFLHGRLWVERCPEIDCAVFGGRTYIIFPPLPAVVAMPFIAVFGFSGFKGFILLALALVGLALVLWRSILKALDVADADARWLILALGFASPLFQVTLRADNVWFFAQAVGFLMMTLSLWAVICRRSLALAGVFVAAALLCRQMALLYPLFLVFLAMPREKSLRDAIPVILRPALVAAIPVVTALALIFAYNAARFGAPLDTGYSAILNPGNESFISRRIADLGLWSRDYLLFNSVYLFLQGVHFEFSGPYLTRITGLDTAGVALLVTSPWLLLAYFSRLDRTFTAGATTILLIGGVTLFYHSNGAAQINTQRYVLDWLPILVVLMARGARSPAFAALPLLVTAGIVTNAAVVFLAAALKV